jgi:SAM-dependent methyltransferase
MHAPPQRRRQHLAYLPYPPTAFPVRDLFLLDWIPLEADADVLEIGVGSGYTTARMAGLCRGVTGVDIADEALHKLAYLERRHANLALRTMDVTAGGTLGRRFDSVLSFDTLEHIADPPAYFRFIAAHLAPRGTAHVLFPNETPAAMHGITRLESAAAIDALVRPVFASHDAWVADLSAWARTVEWFSYKWFRSVRAFLCRRRPLEPAPQTFSETLFYRKMALWKTLSPLINAWWHVGLVLCRLGGSAYRLRPVRDADFASDHNLYIRLSQRTPSA